MSIGFRPDAYTEKDLKVYLEDVVKHSNLDAELQRVQKFLQKLHRGDFFQKYPNETPETRKQLVYKFTQLFHVLLGYREQQRQKQAKADLVVPVHIEY